MTRTDQTDPVTVGQVSTKPERVSVEIRLGPDFAHEISLDISGERFGSEPDFLLPLTLLPAMRAGSALSLPGSFSPRLLAGADRVQDVFHAWDDESFRRVEVRASERAGSRSRPAGVGCFFSGGVDSFYTALKHLPEITHFVFMRGAFDSQEAMAAATKHVNAAGAALGKPVITLDVANMRAFTRAARVTFSDYGGSWLAAAALLFQHLFGRVYVASTFSYAALHRWGSHPLIDPHWSTETLEVVHDGSEATRPMKIERLAESDVAMRWLRVCHTGADGNCGRCSKCVRTMVNLRAVGALGRCSALPDELDLDFVAAERVADERDLAFVTENLRVLAARGTDPDLEDALRSTLADTGFEVVGAGQLLTLRRDLRRSEYWRAKRERELQGMRRSLSWRLTAPVRWLGRLHHR